jgi:hypothetical protein
MNKLAIEDDGHVPTRRVSDRLCAVVGEMKQDDNIKQDDMKKN